MKSNLPQTDGLGEKSYRPNGYHACVIPPYSSLDSH